MNNTDPRAADPYLLGHGDRYRGVPASANPFGRRSAESRELWDAGWAEADRELSETPNPGEPHGVDRES